MYLSKDKLRRISHFTYEQFKVLYEVSIKYGIDENIKLRHFRDLDVYFEGKADIGERNYHIFKRAVKNIEKSITDIALLFIFGILDKNDLSKLLEEAIDKVKTELPELFREEKEETFIY